MNPETGFEEAAIYKPLENEWIYLGGLGSVLDGSESSVWGMSSNGEHLVGLSWVSGGTAHGVAWDYPAPIIDLGSTVAGRSSRANNVSSDGSRVVGWQDSDFGNRQGVYWENGEQHFLKDNDGSILGEATGMSADGKTVTGFTLDRVGYIWNEEEGTILYNPNADEEYPEDFFTSLPAISDDGTVAVGFSFNPFEGGILQGSSFIWTKEDGFTNLNDFVAGLGYDDLGIDFSLANAVLPDGKYIGGIGVNWDLGDARGFVIKLPETMGTQDELASNSVLAYPNPTKNVLNILSQTEIRHLEMYNLLGQKVSTPTILNNQLDVSSLVKGIYILKVHSGKEVKSIRIIKE